MRWSTVLKFFLGVLLAIVVLAGGGVVAARVMIARLSILPPKPMFPNDTPTKPAAKPAAKPATAKPETDKPETDKPETGAKPLPAGAFPARVSQSIGLILRDAPSRDGGSVGGVDFNERVTVVETSADGSWQKIRLSNDTEGWVRAGNVEKVTP
jgi:hypothetical protein